MDSPFEKPLITILLNYPDHQEDILAQIKPIDFIDTEYATILKIVGRYRQEHIDDHAPCLSNIVSILKLYLRETEIESTFGTKSLNSYVAQNWNTFQSPTNIERYVKEIKKVSKRRNLHDSFALATERILNPALPVGDVIKNLEEGIDVILDDQNKNTIFYGDSFKEYRRQQLVDRYMGDPPLKTHFYTLNEHLVEGFRPTKMSIIAGRPSMGKSMFKANLILGWLEMGLCIASFSPEQGGESESDRLESMQSKIPQEQIINVKSWGKNDERWKLMSNSRSWFAKQHYFLIDDSLYYDELFFKLRKINKISERKVDILIIDLFKDLRDFGDPRLSDREITDKLLLRAEHDCVKHDVHLLIIHQLNRETEKRVDQIPKLSDLKGAGIYEEKASNIFFIHRDARKDLGGDMEDTSAKIIIAKQRNGPSPRTTELDFNPSTLRFGDKIEDEQKQVDIKNKMNEFDEEEKDLW